MTYDQAYEAINTLSGFYNKKLDEDQLSLWINEIEALDEVTVRKVLKDIKVNPSHTIIMPTLPQFTKLFKKYENEVKVEQDFCYVCNNKGMDIVRIIETIGDKQYMYDLSLHCDFCQRGREATIDITNKAGRQLFSEPISKYCNIEERIKENKIRAKHAKENKLKTAKNHKQIVFKLLSKIGV